MLEFRNVSKIYTNNIDKDRRQALKEIFWMRRRGRRPMPGETLAVRDISFSVEEGSPLLIVGPAGSGKTTIARLACGLAQPSSGTVRIGGTARLVNYTGTGVTPFMGLRHYVHLLAMSYGAGAVQARQIFDKIIQMDEFREFASFNIKRMPKSAVKSLNHYLELFVDADIYVFDQTFAADGSNVEPVYRQRIEEIINSRAALVLSESLSGGFRSFAKETIVLDEGEPVYCDNLDDAVTAHKRLAERRAVRESARTSSAGGLASSEVSRILRVELTDADGREIDRCVDTKGRACVPSTQDLYVSILCRILKPQVTVGGAVDVYANGTYVFGGRQSFISVESPSLYRLRMMIPANLLANNLYTLNVSVIAYDDSMRHKAALHNALEFRVASPVEADAAGSGRVMSGVLVAPRLDWDFAVEDTIGGLD